MVSTFGSASKSPVIIASLKEQQGQVISTHTADVGQWGFSIISSAIIM
jgi:hypothetical protein